MQAACQPFSTTHAGTDIEGVCVVLLDTLAAGCIDTYVGDGSLGRERYEVLVSCLNDLDRTMPAMPEELREYFEILKAMCVAVVRDTKSRYAQTPDT